MRGFRLTADYDLDLDTPCEDLPEVVGAAAIVGLRTWRGECPGNLRLGVDGALLALRAPPEEIASTLQAEARAVLSEPPLPGLTLDSVEVRRESGRLYHVTAEGAVTDPQNPGAPPEPITIENVISL